MDEEKFSAFRLDLEERVRLKNWFDAWAEREGETLFWHEGMDCALVGKAQVWRVNRWIWVPVYQYELMTEKQMQESPDDEDILDILHEKYLDKYFGHMTPVINYGCIQMPDIQSDPFMEDLAEDEEEDEEPA